MNFTPFTVARYGVYVAIAVAIMSIYLGHQNGATFEFVLLRAVGLFVIVTALGLGAEAVLTVESPPTHASPPARPATTDTADNAEEGSPE